MIEAIFYLQVIFFVVLLGYSLYSRSYAILVLAGLFSILTGALIASEGISYPTGFNVSGVDDNVMYWESSYTTYNITNSNPISMWHYVLFYGGFGLLVASLFFILRNRSDSDGIK